MASSWEATFSSWAQPPSQTEQAKIDNSIRAVRKAVDASEALKSCTKLFVQGSYRNRVNVRQDSDVDIGILYTGNTFLPAYPPGMGHKDFGNIDGDKSYSSFKDEIGASLIRYFGTAHVKRGNKAFDIHENTYRVDADVVPLFVHRRYDKNGSYICGVELRPDDGQRIINWPERLYDHSHWPNQHYENAVGKNGRTNRAYKGMVRILKKLRNNMDEEDVGAAKPIVGFLVECMVWNAPESCFAHSTWHDDLRAVLLYLWSSTKNDSGCEDWREVSELKYLFRGDDQKRQRAHAFIDSVWGYVGMK